MTTSTPTRPASADRRRAILDAALRSFSAHGYERTSIGDVRQRSGASTGSIYHHFGDKAGLAAALYLDGLERWQSAMLEGLGPDARDAEAALRGVVVAHFAWVAEHPDLARFLLARRPPEMGAETERAVRALNRRFGRAVERWIDRAQASGAIRHAPAHVFLAAVLGPCQELTRGHAARLERIPRAEVEQVAEIVWNGLRQPRERTA